jgi:hypothetical protein
VQVHGIKTSINPVFFLEIFTKRGRASKYALIYFYPW